jgi:acetyltransferase-like isoleucine patch superfamily enzyme
MDSPIAKRNVLLEGTAPLTAKQKGMFKYFGVGSKIKPSYRILNPYHRIHVGDITSIQEYSHNNAFSDLPFLMDYIEPRYKKAFESADYLYDSEVHIDRECQIRRFLLHVLHGQHPNSRECAHLRKDFRGRQQPYRFPPERPHHATAQSKGKTSEIKKGAWIGVGAAVLKGTSLGMNSVVGANSVVQGIFPDHAIIAAPRAQLTTTRKKIVDVESGLYRTKCPTINAQNSTQ